MSDYYPYRELINNFFYKDGDILKPKTFYIKLSKRKIFKIKKIIKRRDKRLCKLIKTI